MFTTEVIKQTPFPNDVRLGDTYIQLKIGQTHSAVIIPDGLTWWRRRSGNATSRVMGDSKYNAEMTNFYLELLDDNCPLSVAEIEEAKINQYGIYLRLLFWLIIKGKFNDFIFLRKRVHIPRKYLKSFFVPRKKGVFNEASGDNPLNTPMLSKPL